MNSNRPNSTRTHQIVVTLLGVGALLQASEAMAQQPPATGSPHQAGALPLKERPKGDAAVINAVVDSIGLIRGFGPMQTTKTVNRLRWGGDGTMTEGPRTYKITRFDYSVSLLQQAARLDYQRTGADGSKSRVIKVVAGRGAWNESTPGVYTGLAADDLKARQLAFWRTPAGLAKALTLAAPGSVKVTDSSSGPVQLDFKVEDVPLHVILDQDYRPWRVEQQVGKDKVVDEYTQYADLTEYGIMFAKHSVETVNGKPFLDLHVNDADVASYIVFPAPATLASAK